MSLAINGTDGIDLNLDNAKIKLGASDDLQIYHDGTDNVIGSSGLKNIVLKPKDTDVGLKVIGDGAVELYYDNAKKAETVTGGFTVTGTCTATDFAGDGSNLTGISSVGGATALSLNDSTYINCGTGNDLQIYHDGSNSYIKNNTGRLHIGGNDLGFLNYATNEWMVECDADGAVKLYHDGTKQVETDANGIQFDDGKGLTFGTNDNLTVKHSTNDTTFLMTPVGYINFNFDGNDATTAIVMRIQKTGDATNNERHQMFSFGLPGVNRGLAQSGSSNSEAPIWAASSDYRIKENFRPYTGGWDAIKAIPVQLYDEKSPSYWTQGADKKDMKGWRAHEVQAVIPEAVTGDKDAVVTQALIDAPGNQYQQSELGHIIPQQLGTTAMIPTLIGALQQAMTKIETLEAKVAALEAG